MKEGSHKKVQKIRMVQNGPPYLSIKKKNSGGQREEGHGVVHHLQQEQVSLNSLELDSEIGRLVSV